MMVLKVKRLSLNEYFMMRGSLAVMGVLSEKLYDRSGRGSACGLPLLACGTTSVPSTDLGV